MSSHKRRLASIFLLTGAALALLGLIAVIVLRHARIRGALNGLPDPNLPPRVPVLGINVDLTQYDAGELNENLDLISRTGFVWLRQSFRWQDIEPQPGTYNWATYDALVEASAGRGLRIVAVLEQAPGWAASHPTALPEDLAHFSSFAAAVAARYASQIDVYQIWDEPNLSGGWGGIHPSAVRYAALLESAYWPIHHSDPDAFVLSAALAPTSETGPENISDILYLRALYEAGADRFFDGVAAKPYGFDAGHDDRTANPGALNFSRTILLREVMEQYGDIKKPLWISEFGWNALPQDWDGGESIWGQVTLEDQAENTIGAYHRALIEWPWTGAVILESWQPDAPHDDPRWGFALRGTDGTLSLTALAIQSHSGDFNTSLWPGVHSVNHELIAFSDSWSLSGLGADIGRDGNSAIDLTFTGDQLAVIARRGWYRGYLYVTVDGEPSALLPRDNRGAYLVLTSPDYTPATEVLPIASGDMDTTRRVHIEAEQGQDQWTVAGFAVGSKIPTTIYNAAIIGLGVLSIVLGFFAFMTGKRANWSAVTARSTPPPADKMPDVGQFLLAFAAALVMWLGAARTWGGGLLRRMGDGPSLLITTITAGLFYFSPWLLLTLIALVVLFVLIYSRPSFGVALVVFFAPYYMLPRPLFDRAFTMVEVISLLTLAAWAIHIAASYRENRFSWRDIYSKLTALDRAVILFAVISALSIAWSDLLGVAVTEFRQIILEPLILYLVLRTMRFSPRERWRIVDMLVLAGLIVSLIGLYEFATGIDIITAEEGSRRLRSVFGSPNSTALFLDRVIPVALAVALLGGSGDPRRRIAYGIAGSLMGIAFALTLSKGGLLLGLPAALALIVIAWFGWKGIVAVFAAGVLEILALVPLSRLPRFGSLTDFNSETSTTFFRLNLWKSTYNMLRDHPITGVGLDQFLYQYRGRYILPASWQEPNLSHPHNFLLDYWVRSGLVAVAAGIWMQVAFWRIAVHTAKVLRQSDRLIWALVIGLMASMAAFIGHGLVDAAHYAIDLAFIFALTLGVMFQLSQEVRDGSDH